MEKGTPQSTAGTSVQTHLRAIADILHHGEKLDPQMRAALADFIEELSNTIISTPVPSKDLEHLTECAAHLLKIEQQHEEGIQAAARERLEKAIFGIQTQFPNVAAIARSLVDTLANIGI